MKTDSLLLYCAIKPELLRKALFKGTLISALGLVPIFWAFSSLNTSAMGHWGLLIFLLGLGMIGVGMIPYKKLTWLEKHPHKIEIINHRGLFYFEGGNRTLTIPFSAIEELDYYEKDWRYGIRVLLKKKLSDKVKVHKHGFDFAKYQKYSHTVYKCDIFLPYFTKRNFEKLVDLYEEETKRQ